VFGTAKLAALDNPHGITVAACAKAPPSCTGSFPGVPVYDSNQADDALAPILGCIGAHVQLPATTGCPVQLPTPGSGTFSEYQFWVLPGGPSPTGNNSVVECRKGTGSKSCGAYIRAEYDGSLQGCFSQAKAANACPTEMIAGFPGSTSFPPRYYSAALRGDPPPEESGGSVLLVCSTPFE
jgi:hypothetical protein